MISAILNSNGDYSLTDIQLFEANTTCRNLLKDEMLIKPGEVCKSIFFNLSGAIYQYNYKDEMEENVIDLHLSNEWFLNHNSFITQLPSGSFIKAFTNSKILELNIESLHYLIGKSPAFLQLGRIFEQSTSRVHFFDNRLTPAEKYQYILDNRSALIQNFSLKLIASYLKITPETLSRVRENLSKQKTVS
ncbi:Crp/Fnr family transcriptional regulator [soil metagenome]